MTRKDIEKESERPHYYSQFWLDVAAGRRIIGTPKTSEDGEPIDLDASEPAPQRRAGRVGEAAFGATDRRSDAIVHPVAEPLSTPTEFIEPDTEELDLTGAEAHEEEYQDATVEDADIPDMDLGSSDEDEELSDDDEEEEEEEDEEDADWGRGRKKAKPVRATKVTPKKPVKRDSRRSY